MFPAFQEIMDKPGFLIANVNQHHSFEPGLKTLQAFAIDTEPKDYKSEVLQSIIQDFASDLQQHLHHEMPSLLAMKLYDSDALLRAYKISEAAASKQDKVLQRITVTLHSPIGENGLQTVVPPMVLGLYDEAFQGVNNWHVMPWFAPYIVHYLFGRKHARSWRLLPCDAWRNPRPLIFSKSQRPSLGSKVLMGDQAMAKVEFFFSKIDRA